MSAINYYSRRVRIEAPKLAILFNKLDCLALPRNNSSCSTTITTRRGWNDAGLLVPGYQPKYLLRMSGVQNFLRFAFDLGIKPAHVLMGIALHEVRHNVQFCEGLDSVVHASELENLSPLFYEQVKARTPLNMYPFTLWVKEFDAYARQLCFLFLCHSGEVECNIETAKEFIVLPADELAKYFETCESILAKM